MDETKSGKSRVSEMHFKEDSGGPKRLRLHGSGQIFARTKTCMVLPCVHTGLVEPDKFLNGQVCMFGT